MPLKDTVSKMKVQIEEIGADLEKASRGNKSASQRVRTGSVRFSKLAKVYRMESVLSERNKS